MGYFGLPFKMPARGKKGGEGHPSFSPGGVDGYEII